MREKTFTLKYVIRKEFNNSSGTYPIYLRYSYSRKFCNIPLGENIEMKHFIEQNGTLSSKCPNSLSLGKKMTDLWNKVENVVLDYYNKHETYPETNGIVDLIEEYNKKNKIKKLEPNKRTLTVEELFKMFLKDREEKHLKSSTFVVYNQFWTKWEDFEKTTKKYTIKELNDNVFNKFGNYLLNQGLQTNSIGKQMKTLKSFLNYVYKIDKVNISKDFQNIKVHKENNDFVVLTELEVEKLSSFVLYSRVYNHPSVDLDLTERERYIGRIFLFLCSTGLSYIDYNRLTIDNIFITENKDFNLRFVNIKITRQKLKSTIDCVIPIIGRTIDLLFVMLGYTYYEKDYDRSNPFYEGIKEKDKIKSLSDSIYSIKNDLNSLNGKKYYPRIFPKISDQKFNKGIKEVLKKIGVTERVKVNKIKLNEKDEVYKEKWSLVSSHTGRRTYVTWCISKGIDRSYIMSTTGHKNTQTLHRYTKTDDTLVNMEYYKKITLNEQDIREKMKRKKKKEIY